MVAGIKEIVAPYVGTGGLCSRESCGSYSCADHLETGAGCYADQEASYAVLAACCADWDAQVTCPVDLDGQGTSHADPGGWLACQDVQSGLDG